MNILIYKASKGKQKNGNPWMSLTYSVGKVDESADRMGLNVIQSFVGEAAQAAVWKALQGAGDFPIEATMEVSTSNGRTVEVSGVKVSRRVV